MNQFWLLCPTLLLIITTTTVSANAGLRTQQGIIYGRQTQISMEYLG